MRTTIFPKDYNRNAFYIKFKNMQYRVYKVEYFFSTVGGAWFLEFFISNSNLKKFKESKYCVKGADSFWIADIPKVEIDKVINKLKITGICDII